MAWRHVLLLTALAGCELPPLPKTVHAQDRFSERERAVIEDVFRETNDILLRPCLGEDGLIFGGYADVTPFDVMGDAYGDDLHVIYKLYRDEAPYEVLSCIAGRDFGGNATLQDVLMVSNLDGLDDLEEEEAEARRAHFRRVLLHELGHHVGLTHHPDPDALMHAGPKTATTFTDSDRAAFALARGCAYP